MLTIVHSQSQEGCYGNLGCINGFMFAGAEATVARASKLIFNETPVVEFASNTFINVPVIFQIDDEPLIEFVKVKDAGFTTEISIYHNDGTYLAKVKGSQIYKTPAGRKAGLKMSHPGKLTVCELKGETLFELRRDHAAALKLSAELYTPRGGFIKAHNDININNEFGNDGMGVVLPPGVKCGLKDLTFTCDTNEGIGILLHTEGWLELAVNCKVRQDWKGDPPSSPHPNVWVRMQSPEGVPGVSNVKLGPSHLVK